MKVTRIKKLMISGISVVTNNEFEISYVGKITPQKGVGELISAFKHLQAKNKYNVHVYKYQQQTIHQSAKNQITNAVLMAVWQFLHENIEHTNNAVW